jgi:hypothetical protein
MSFYCTACNGSYDHESGCKYEKPFHCPGCGRNVPLERHVPGCGYPVPFTCPDCMRPIPTQEHHPNCDYVGLIITHEEMSMHLRRWGRPSAFHPAQQILHFKRPDPRRRWSA